MAREMCKTFPSERAAEPGAAMSGCAGFVVGTLICGAILLVVACFYGWLAMLLLGILGHPLPFWPDCVGIGAILAVITGGVGKSSR